MFEKARSEIAVFLRAGLARHASDPYSQAEYRRVMHELGISEHADPELHRRIRERVIELLQEADASNAQMVTLAYFRHRVPITCHDEQVMLIRVMEESQKDDGAIRWFSVNGSEPGYYLRSGSRDPLRGYRDVPEAEWGPLVLAGIRAYAERLQTVKLPAKLDDLSAETRGDWRDAVCRLLLLGDEQWFGVTGSKAHALRAIRAEMLRMPRPDPHILNLAA